MGVHPFHATRPGLRRIGLRRDGQRDRARHRGRAAAIFQQKGELDRCIGVVAVGLVGQRFDQRLDRGRRGAGIQRHGQVGAVLAIGGDGADLHAAEADRGPRDPDLPCAVALVLDAQRSGESLFEQADVTFGGDGLKGQPTSGKIGVVGIRQGDRAVQQHRPGIERCLGQVDFAGKPVDLGRHRQGKSRSGRQQARQEHIIAGGRRVVDVVADDDQPVRQHHDGRLLRCIGYGRRDRHLAFGIGCAVRVEAAHHDFIGIAVADIVGVPGHDEAAIRRCRDRRLVLGAKRRDIDLELCPDRRAVRLEDPCLNGRTRPVAGTGGPGHHEPPARQHRDLRIGPVQRGVRGHGEFGNRLRSRRREDRGHDVARPRGVGLPDRNIAGTKCRHLRRGLGAGRTGVQRDFATHRRSDRVEALGADVIGEGVVVVRTPRHDIATAGQTHHRRLVLRRIGLGVHHRLGPGLHPGGRELLHADFV